VTRVIVPVATESPLVIVTGRAPMAASGATTKLTVAWVPSLAVERNRASRGSFRFQRQPVGQYAESSQSESPAVALLTA